MKRKLLFMLLLVLSICSWAVNYTVSVTSSDPLMGYVDIEINDGDDYYSTDDLGTGTIDVELAKNTKVKLTAVCNDDDLYRFVRFEGSINTTKSDYTINKLTKDYTITAVFEEIPTYTVTVTSQGANGGYISIWSDNDLEGDCESAYDDAYEGGSSPFCYESWVKVYENTEVKVAIELIDGYRFLGLYDGKTLLTADIPTYTAPYTFIPTSDKTLTARFELIPTYTVTVTSLGENGGYIYVWSDNDLEGDCESAYDDAYEGGKYPFCYESWVRVYENTEVKVAIELIDGYRFLGLYDGETLLTADIPTYTAPYTFIPTSDKTLTARFEEIPQYTITVETNLPNDLAGTTVSGTDIYGNDFWQDDGSVDIYEGSTATIEVWSKNGTTTQDIHKDYRWLGWYDGDTKVSDELWFDITVSANKTYTARFEIIPRHKITVSVEPSELDKPDYVEVEVGYDYEYEYWNSGTGKWEKGTEYVWDEGTRELLVPEGAKAYVWADSQNENVKFVRWNDNTTNNYYSIDVTEDKNYTAIFDVVPPEGYSKVGTTNLYANTNYNVDIIGHEQSTVNFYSTTYNNGGFDAVVKVGNNAAQYVNANGSQVNGIKVAAQVMQAASLARVVYTFTNTTSADLSFSFGNFADVQIGENDSAPIERIIDSEGKTLGITMKDGQGQQLYIIFGVGKKGSSLVDDYWFGDYGEVTISEEQIVGNYQSNIHDLMIENGSYDSAMGWCWKNRTLAAGQSMALSFMVGMGEVVMAPSSSLMAPTLANPASWNDISAEKNFVVEGIYDHVAGLNGMIEYAVEEVNSDADWKLLATTPAVIETGEYFSGSLSAMFDAAKSVHTLHFRARDVLGNTTVLPSVQYEDMSAYELTGSIVNKVYNGKAQEQSGLTISPELDTEKYSVVYSDNVNVGTAKITLQGVFPYTVGKKEYTFQINPQPLAGSVYITESGMVYNGEAHTPAWRFSDYSGLREDTDYKVTWKNNTLPGTATLTVKGINNYEGTLTAQFDIDKAQVTSSMYAVTLPDDVLYDGAAHTASLEVYNSDLGAATLLYWNGNAFVEPLDKGEYSVILSIDESSLYHAYERNMGSFNIYRLDAEEWAALQALNADLSQHTWFNPWDLSAGEASVGTLKGVSLTNGHITSIDLSNNGLDGNFPKDALLLPYLSSLNLSNNNLNGKIDEGIQELVQTPQWAAINLGMNADGTINIKVKKPDTWSTVYLWAWLHDPSSEALNNLFDTWPGALMTDDGDGWWSYDNLPVGINLVFSDNGYPQTIDINYITQNTAFTLAEGTQYTVASQQSFISGDQTLSKGLRSLDISSNSLAGNIGAFAQAVPSLVVLKASDNNLEEVSPMLSTKIGQLNLHQQQVLQPRVIDLREVSADSESLLSKIPTIMLYNHSEQNYEPKSEVLMTLDDSNAGSWHASAVVTDADNGQWEWSTDGYNSVFSLTSDDALTATNPNSTSTFQVKLLFADGDANFTGDVDVLDLQASINYIFGEYGYQHPFNFTAANLFADATINVQDIVLLIDKLLSDETEPSDIARRRIKAEQVDLATAELRWENGELHLTSAEPVAALDLRIEASASIEWTVASHTVSTKQSSGVEHAVVYSLAGSTFPAQTDVVIARSLDLEPVTVSAKLADKQAQPISVSTLTVPANIPTSVTNEALSQLTISVSDNTLVVNTDIKSAGAAWTVYDMNGKRVGNGILSEGRQTLLTLSQTGTFLLVVSDANGNMITSEKIINK